MTEERRIAHKGKVYIPDPYFACGNCGDQVKRCDKCGENFDDDMDIYCVDVVTLMQDHHVCGDCIKEEKVKVVKVY